MPVTHQDGGISVSLTMKKKKKTRKITGINIGLFVSGDLKKKIFDQKKLQIKMSSAMQFASNAVELYVVTINGKPWTSAREVCKALSYEKKNCKHYQKS